MKKNTKSIINTNKLFVQFIVACSLVLGLQADFTKSGDVVTDNVSGLSWEDKSGVTDSTSTKYAYTEATTYCQEATTGGHSDWRLPNIYELHSILDRSKGVAPAINGAFLYTASSYYWSSTTLIANTDQVLVDDFYYGFTTAANKTNLIYTRCVRGGNNP